MHLSNCPKSVAVGNGCAESIQWTRLEAPMRAWAAWCVGLSTCTVEAQGASGDVMDGLNGVCECVRGYDARGRPVSLCRRGLDETRLRLPLLESGVVHDC